MSPSVCEAIGGVATHQPHSHRKHAYPQTHRGGGHCYAPIAHTNFTARLLSFTDFSTLYERVADV